MVDAALTELDLDYDFDIISDIPAILEYGVERLPALVINGEVKLEGKTPSVEEVIDILKEM